jgi:hypothetical protein
MEPPAELDRLPRAYRIGLRLQSLGADDELIGECLGIDPAGVATLIEIGLQKLEAGRTCTHHVDTARSESASVDSNDLQ